MSCTRLHRQHIFILHSFEGTQKKTLRAQNSHPLLSLVMLSSGAGRPLIVSGVSKDLHIRFGRLRLHRRGDPRLFLVSPAGRARGAAHRARGFDPRRRARVRGYFSPRPGPVVHALGVDSKGFLPERGRGMGHLTRGGARGEQVDPGEEKKKHGKWKMEK